MKKEDILTIIKWELKHEYEIPDSKITYNASLENDLGFDSLCLNELSMILEEGFDIELSAEELFECKTIEKIVDLIYNKMEKK